MAKFDKPLETWLEEEIDLEVVKPVFDGQKVTIQTVVEKAKQKVFYAKEVKTKMTCKEKDHYWILEDPGTYDFACKHCMTHKIAYPVTYYYKDGKLIHY